MKTIEDGHVYLLDARRGSNKFVAEPGPETLTFVNREPGHEHDGTTTQEVIRSLIDRTQYCDHCLPWEGNRQIVEHLRMALTLHEVRAIVRKVETGQILPELLQTAVDGHWILRPGHNALPPRYAFPAERAETNTGGLKPGEPCHSKGDQVTLRQCPKCDGDALGSVHGGVPWSECTSEGCPMRVPATDHLRRPPSR